MLDPRHAILFEPVRIGPKVLPNRFYQVPHASGFGSQKPQTQAAFRGIKAEGGWGGVCVEYAPVSARRRRVTACGGLPARRPRRRRARTHGRRHPRARGTRRDGAVPRRQLQQERRVPACAHRTERSHGCRAVGVRCAGDDARRHRPGAGGLRRERPPRTRRRLRHRLRVRGARLPAHAVPVHAGATGGRTATAGTLAGPGPIRARDPRAGARRGRRRLCDRHPHLRRRPATASRASSSSRCSSSSHWPTRWSTCSTSTVGSWPEDSGTSRYYPEGHQLSWTSRVREATAKPIVGVGRYTNADQMAAVDPLRRLRPDRCGPARDRRSVPARARSPRAGSATSASAPGANVCIMKEEAFGHVGCIQNATAGEEYRRGWHPERFERHARPRARRARRRRGTGRHGVRDGARPTRLRGRPPRRGRGRGRRPHPLDAAAADARRLGPRRRLAAHPARPARPTSRSSPADGSSAADVLDYGADIVVVATGSRWSATAASPGGSVRSACRRPAGGADARADHDGRSAGRPAGRGVRRRRLLRGSRHRRAARGRGLRRPPRHARAGRLADLGRHARGAHAAPAPARRRDHDARRRHGAGARAGSHRRRDAVRRPVAARGRRPRPRHAPGAVRRALPAPSSPTRRPSTPPGSPPST